MIGAPRPDPSLTRSALMAAIEGGLAYLARSQRLSGEFTTMTSPHLEMRTASPRPKSTYVTTFVLHALTHLPAQPLIAPLQQKAADFLRREQETGGAWHYDGRGDHTIPTDLDCTACAVAALHQLGQRPDLSFYSLLWQNEVAPGGPYYTWIGIDHTQETPTARDVDLLVNANLLFCAGLLGLDLPGLTAYLTQAIRASRYEAASVYCVSAHFPLYALSRADRDGGVSALAPLRSTLREYILARLPGAEAEPSAFNLACLAVSLLNLAAPPAQVEPYLAALLAQQQNDGGWPAWAVYLSYGRHYDGAPALTTALALEALGKYRQHLKP